MDIDSLVEVGEDEGESDDEDDNNNAQRRDDGDDNSDAQSQDGENNEDDAQPRDGNNRPRIDSRIRRPLSFAMNFRDIEDSIRSFDGGDSYPVERWIKDFEELAALYRWTELERVIFAKKSLTGLAKLFVQSEGAITKWSKLRSLLRDEFGTVMDSAQLHDALVRRKMKRDETVQEYYLVMKELASRGDIKPSALIQYVIDGIQDDVNSKAVLFNAKNLRDFKEQLRVYESMRRAKRRENVRSGRGREDAGRRPDSRRTTEPSRGAAEGMKKRNTTTDVGCYNCGEKGHVSRDCVHRSKGKRCFKCQSFGHIAVDCGKNERDKTSLSLQACGVANNKSKNDMCKEIEINGTRVSALIDTGSQVTVLRENVYNNAGLGRLNDSDALLIGFGKSETKTLGYVQAIIKIDGEEFPTTMYVVSDNLMNRDAVIGSDILSCAEVRIDNNGIVLRKMSNAMFLTSIQIADERTLDLGHIKNVETRDELENLISAYESKGRQTTNIEMRITMKDETPISQKPRRLPVTEKEIVEKQIVEWIENGIIEPCASEYASPVVVVRKRDGSPRVCIDYRKLNRAMEKDKYPLPLIEELLDKLQNACVFSSIDLKNGFFHVAVATESRKYTAFVTHSGQYQFLRMPFGLSNAPSVFQRFINHIFRDLNNRGIAFSYLDDIVIPASSDKEGLLRLRLVLEVASEYGLQINERKCKFIQKRLEFLGHIVEAGKIYPSDDKVKAVVNFPPPRKVVDVQRFLGLSGYFRKFIYNYSIIAKSLSDLLKKDKACQFDERERDAFYELKRSLTRRPVLQIYNPRNETEIHTDACKDGYGAVLMQRSSENGHFYPVYYMSRKTKREEQNYSSYELEALAIVKALEKFRTYLLGIEFKIVTDCAAFQRTINKQELIPRIARWVLFLEDYRYTIEHRSGTRMKHVDALSRHAIETIVVDLLTPKICKLQEEDSEIKVILEILKDRPYENYCTRDRLLYKFVDGREVLVVPRGMQAEVIQSAHQKGHFAVKRTEEIIKQDYFISDLKRKVEKCINNCIACITTNRKAGKSEGFLHPLEKNDVPLHTYHVDHLGPLETTHKNYNHILVVIDSFSKFVWLYPTKSTTTREVLNRLDLQKRIFGNPVQIVSDRGTAFTSKEFADYCSEENIRHALVTTGLPRANGQVERINRTIIPVLAKLSIENPARWYKHVDKLQRILNSTFQRSIAMTPFELLFGVKMREKNDIILKELIENEFSSQFDQERNKMRAKAKEQILKTQEENRKVFNRKRKKASQYVINDLVAIKRTQMGPGRKLRAKYLGPYRIVKVKVNDTYDVEKIGLHEGPMVTSTCSEYLKPWMTGGDSSESDD